MLVSSFRVLITNQDPGQGLGTRFWQECHTKRCNTIFKKIEVKLHDGQNNIEV